MAATDHTQDIAQHGFPAPGTAEAKRIGAINWMGLYTLFQKESRRFMKIWIQTLAAPAVTTILFMIIFTVALGKNGRVVSGMDFATFLAPGLMVMAMLQNAFANTSSSILIGKVQGNIVDILMPPLSAAELMIGHVAGGVARGMLVGLSVALAFYLMPGVELGIHAWWAVVYFAISATVLLSLIGVLTGIWAEKFDHSATITNFIIAPLTLLSGTFYSIERLDPVYQAVSRINPFFYVIDGFRYGFIGRGDSDLMIGAIYLLVLNIILWLAAHHIFKRGYRLKA